LRWHVTAAISPRTRTLTSNGSHYLLVYQQELSASPCPDCPTPVELDAVVLDRSGQPSAPPVRLGSSGSNIVAAVAAGGGGPFLVSWINDAVFHARIGDDGRLLDAPRQLMPHDSVCCGLFAVWDGGVFSVFGPSGVGKRIDANGTVLDHTSRGAQLFIPPAEGFMQVVPAGHTFALLFRRLFPAAPDAVSGVWLTFLRGYGAVPARTRAVRP